MEDGMVVTVEPGIYVNGLGGVRIEDMVVVRGSNPEILTTSVKDITVL
jgi:Xaa-Pro aminopeptidase